MIFIKQCKGKDLDKVAKSKLDKGHYYTSHKYDGNYVQIHKIGNELIFFSSGGIRFKLDNVEDEMLLLDRFDDFILEAEYIANTDGSLGSRGKCSTTTFRTQTKKGNENILPDNHRFMIFDILYYHDKTSVRSSVCPTDMTFDERYYRLEKMNLPKCMQVIRQKIRYFDSALKVAKEMVNDGQEGMVITKHSHLQLEGKRVNNRIKLKFYPTVGMTIISTSFGTGQYKDVISSLLLEDNKGIRVNVGGVIIGELGITDENYFIGKICQIEYESFDKTYVQPRIKKLWS